MFTTNGTYPWSFVTQIFHNGQPSHGGDCESFEVMTSTLPRRTLGSVASLLAATLYQGNPLDLSKSFHITKPFFKLNDKNLEIHIHLTGNSISVIK